MTKAKKSIETFKGYDHRPVISDGSWYDEKNLSSDQYPLLSVRRNRARMELPYEVEGWPERAPDSCKVRAYTAKDQLVLLDWEGVLWSGGYPLVLIGGSYHVSLGVKGPFTAAVSDQAALLAVLKDEAPAAAPYVWDSTTSRWKRESGYVPGCYTFEFASPFWYYNETSYSAGDLGITVTGDPIDGNTITVQLDCVQSIEGDVSMVNMGAYVVLWPWKIWVNAVKLAAGETMAADADFGLLEQHNEIIADDVNTPTPTPGDNLKRMKISLCNRDGSVYDNVVVSSSAPTVSESSGEGEGSGGAAGSSGGSESEEEDEPGEQPWLDTSEQNLQLRQWSASMSMWVSIPTVYLKIEMDGIADGLKAGDGVNIEFSPPRYYWPQTDRGKFAYDAINGSHVLVDADEASDSIVIVGIFQPGSQEEQQAVVTEQGVSSWTYAVGSETIFFRSYFDQARPSFVIRPYINIDRNAPDLDYVVECGNRLWGCYYGEKDGEIVNEIYASKLGDMKNWNVFEGLSTDSYVASRGGDGPFTGAAVLDGHPLFFRELSVEKVFPQTTGKNTGAHQIQTQTLEGVQKESSQSLVVIDDRLYYKGVGGVYVYTGTLPTMISPQFGEIRYGNVSAGRHGKKYYAAMQDAGNRWVLACYDTQSGLWHLEDAPWLSDQKPGALVTYKDALLLLQSGDVCAVDGGKDARGVSWYCESGILGLDVRERKYISKITMRYRRELGAAVRVYIQYDESGKWLLKESLTGTRLYSGTIQIWPRRCDTFRLRFEGVGGFTLFSVNWERERGSDK